MAPKAKVGALANAPPKARATTRVGSFSPAPQGRSQSASPALRKNGRNSSRRPSRAKSVALTNSSSATRSSSYSASPFPKSNARSSSLRPSRAAAPAGRGYPAAESQVAGALDVITLKIASLSGQEWEVQVEHADLTVREVKLKLGALMGLSVKELSGVQLLCGSEALSDMQTVSELSQQELQVITKLGTWTVAARVRPFNLREQELNAELCVRMDGHRTIVMTDSGTLTSFSLDASFWSHDGFVSGEEDGIMNPSIGSQYASQQTVFDELGKKVLDDALNGIDGCIFAFGQTGAGKSYSMTGYGNIDGILPRIVHDLMVHAELSLEADRRLCVNMSMLEVYNETVHDLFVDFHDRPRHGLCVRESKSRGIYIDGMISRPIDSWTAFSAAHEEAVANRTIGMTVMSATSNRAHSIVLLQLSEATHVDNGDDTRSLSEIMLVDLAGSERMAQAGTSSRLKEGAAINKSLSALGDVLNALAHNRCAGLRNPRIVPYRESKLTRLMQKHLGGDGNKVMLGCISPASTNYAETCRTLEQLVRTSASPAVQSS